MEITYEEDTLLWYWFEDWIVIGGFAVALVIAVWVTGRSSWSVGGLLMKTLMAAAVLAALPLTLVRLGVDIDVSDASTLGYLSLAGAVGSLAMGLPYLVAFRRLKDEAWMKRVAPAYRTAAGVCQHYNGKMTEETLAEEQMTAISLVALDLPLLLEEIRANPEPRSSEARRARRRIERALRTYISSAKLATSLFAELPQRYLAPATWESTSRNARSTIVARVSSEISIARQDMAEAEAYFNPTAWTHSERP